MSTVRIPSVGNKLEVPPGLPAGLWLEELREAVGLPWLNEIPWTDPVVEYLSPDEVIRCRAQALVWRRHIGEWPREVAWWWPVRQARRRGDLPVSDEMVRSLVREDDILVCGKCGARWSPHRDGSAHDPRCKLCGVFMLITSAN